MRVSIERYVQEVIEESHYIGYIRIGGTRLDYEMKFAIPISTWPKEKADWPKDDNEWRKLFGFTLKRDGMEIALSNREYFFFHEQLVFFAQDFWENRKFPGGHPRGALGAILHGQGEGAQSFTSTEESLCIKHYAELHEAFLTDVLRKPKFGCNL